MDFWAQHKDFVLKILAGVGVFLVALIARGVVYGDELESERSENLKLANQIRARKLLETEDIDRLDRDAKVLEKNIEDLSNQIGWDLRRSDFDLVLIRRSLSYLRRFQGEGADQSALDAEAQTYRELIRADLDGGFGQLRHNVKDDLVEEANEKGVRLGAGLGYSQISSIEEDELNGYLMQLELAARIVRYCIDARVDSIDEIRLDKKPKEAIQGANPNFFQEYAVDFFITGEQEDIGQILGRLQKSRPNPPIKLVLLTRLKKPRDHVKAQVTVLACATDPDVSFAKEEGE